MKKLKKEMKYEEKDLREDVEVNLPDDWKLRVFTVTSPDSGNEYFVQILERIGFGKPIVLCDCPQGKFHAPLIIVGLSSFQCKHGTSLLELLERKVKDA
jgi:hypothetical protein